MPMTKPRLLEPDSKDSSSVVPEARKKTYLEAAQAFPATAAQAVPAVPAT